MQPEIIETSPFSCLSLIEPYCYLINIDEVIRVNVSNHLPWYIAF